MEGLKIKTMDVLTFTRKGDIIEVIAKNVKKPIKINTKKFEEWVSLQPNVAPIVQADEEFFNDDEDYDAYEHYKTILQIEEYLINNYKPLKNGFK